PLVTLDWQGGFLVADEREAQVRSYSPEGRLLWYAGARGRGPGEFEAAKVLTRLRSGQVLAGDINGRLTVFDSAGKGVVRTVQAPIDFLQDVEVVDDSLVLMTGIRGGDAQGPRIHLWNLRTDSIVRSFFTPLPNVLNPTLARTANWTSVGLRGDTVAAVFAVSDSVYLYTLSGTPLATIPLPSRHFRRAGRESPPVSARSNPVTRAEWIGRFDYVADVNWRSDGELLVAYISLNPAEALARKWHLLEMTRTGRRVREIRDTPRLLAVDSRSDSLYFINPGSEVESEWAVAYLRD
ncbi:MAG TPA: hypothetical protein VFQ76_07910, partial [Longimicrobiaceae bacterium]|nr:hypothetical protein [Longimicrobiaceae bacterium]